MDYVIIEQTREYRKRMVYNPEKNTFSESEHDCLFYVRGFTFPYGWLKESGTPPDKHLDVILMSYSDYCLGDTVPVKLIGVFKRNDCDHKLIAILPERIETDFQQLTENEKNALYKLYPIVHEGEGWYGVEEAQKIKGAFLAVHP